MSDNTKRHQAEAAVDRLLADSGFTQGNDIRDELLELRSLAATAPLPSEAVRALMAGGAAAARITTADGPSAVKDLPTAVLAAVDAGSGGQPATEAPAPQAPVRDELASRRRKRRAAIAGLAVAVSLAGGATAAAAQEGGIPGTFQHLGAAIGSVVSQLAPGPAPAPQPERPAGPVEELPTHGVHPAPAAPNTTDSAGGATGTGPSTGTDHGNSLKPQGGGVSQTPKTPGNAGNVPIPAPGITPPSLGTPDLPPSLGPSTLPVPVPTQVIPEVPKTPSNPAK